jgi:ABC-type lipoprotein release transport system permease subunit
MASKCIMGIDLASSLGVQIGDTVLVHGPGNLNEVLTALEPRGEEGSQREVSFRD